VRCVENTGSRLSLPGNDVKSEHWADYTGDEDHAKGQLIMVSISRVICYRNRYPQRGFQPQLKD